MGLRAALLSRIITFVYTSSTKTNSKMSRSASSSSKGKVFGSARLHPYAQQLPINPPSNIMQPIPSRAAVHRVLGRRSCSYSHSKGKSVSPHRRRHQTSTMSALNIEGTYDDNDMCDVPVQSIDTISSTETGYTQDQHIKREDTPYPHDMKKEYLGVDYSRSICKYHSFDVALPLPIEWTGNDDINREQRESLDRRSVECLLLAAIGTPQPQEQVQALLSPRVCIDSDANIIDRFVTDCGKSSGRVYDRLSRRELPRIIPYAGDSFPRPISGQVFDVYTGEIRKRCLYDDLRDSNARREGRLEIIEDEFDIGYDAVPDYRSSEIAEASSAEDDNVDPYDYDTDRY
jgi:hypothetical protein